MGLIKMNVVAVGLTYIFLLCCIPFPGLCEGTEDEDVPYGAAGGGVGAAGGGPDPAQLVAKALLCFNDKYIYSSCEESYRVTASGNLNVSPDHTEEYCSGPCLSETHLVLDCIDSILSHFLFYNKATIADVRDTIKAGCGYGPQRGNFDVSEHIEAEEGNGNKISNKIVLPLAMMIMGVVLLH